MYGFVQDSDLQKKLEAVGDKFEDVPIAFTDATEVFTEYGVTGEHGLLLFKKFDEGRVQMPEFSTSTTPEAIHSFVEMHQLPLVIKFTPEVRFRFASSFILILCPPPNLSARLHSRHIPTIPSQRCEFSKHLSIQARLCL